MKDLGFEWDYRPGATPRPTNPEQRLADLDRDGVDAEIIYGCLMINEMIADGELRAWCDRQYNDWAADFAKRSDPKRVFPLAIVPEHRPPAGRGRSASLRQAGAARRRSRVQAHVAPALPSRLGSALGSGRRVPVPDLLSLHRLQGASRARLAGDGEGVQPPVPARPLALFQLDTMEVLVSLLASGACEQYPNFNFVLGESGVTWLPYVFDRLDTEYFDRARGLGLSMKPSDYFRRQGFVTYQQDQFLEPIVPLIGEDNIIWGADYPHPDCLWPESRKILEKNLSGFSETVRVRSRATTSLGSTIFDPSH
jgi:predicted TIM-barrel fold metal-dependent hydrolase